MSARDFSLCMHLKRLGSVIFFLGTREGFTAEKCKYTTGVAMRKGSLTNVLGRELV